MTSVVASTKATGRQRFFSWGSNASGVLGVGDFEDKALPVVLPFAELGDSAEIETGGCHAVIVNSDGRVFSTGNNDQGQLGDEEFLGKSRSNFGVVRALGSTRIRRVACGWAHTLAFGDDGTQVYGWGLGKHGQLGVPMAAGLTAISSPALIPLPDTAQGVPVISIACGWKHSLLLLEDGRIYSTGSNAHGQLGHVKSAGSCVQQSSSVKGKRRHFRGDDENQFFFSCVEFPDVADFQCCQIVCGWLHSAALGLCSMDQTIECARSQIYTWGSNKHGQLGHESEKRGELKCWIPRRTSSRFDNANVVQIQSGWSHMLALTDDGAVYSWGRDNYGQCGRGSVCDTKEELAVNASGAIERVILPGKAQKIACGSEHGAAIVGDDLYTWGWSEHGNLGHAEGKQTASFAFSELDSTARNTLFVSVPAKVDFSSARPMAMESADPMKISNIICGGAVCFCTVSSRHERLNTQ